MFQCKYCEKEVPVTTVVCGECRRKLIADAHWKDDMLTGGEDIVVKEVLDVAECPLCSGTGMVPGSTAPTGDDPERPCDLCAGVGQVPGGYARAYRELLTENDGLDAMVWGLQKQAISAKARIAELRRANNNLKTALAKTQRANAAPADTPRGRRPLPVG